MKNRQSHPFSARLAAAGVFCALLAAGAFGQPPISQVPKELEEVGIDQKLGAQLPLDLRFVDSFGQEKRLAEFFDGRTPVILTLNYYECPMLCHLQLEDLVKSLQLSKMQPGEDFHILTISFNPLETAQLAAAKRDAYLKLYGHERGGQGWDFLVGKRASIDAVTRTVGFKYRWVEENQEYAHAAALILCTPDGIVSRYLGLNSPPDVLRLSLVEASAGKTGTLFEQLFLWCYHYDPARNSYAPVAMGFVRLGAVLTLSALGLTLAGFWAWELRRGRGGPRPGARVADDSQL